MNQNEKPKTKKTSANRDPLTGAPGSHPVGTGVGAAAGGAAAGAAAGTVAGPVGTAVGAGVGAVAGGLGGHAVAENMNPTRMQLERYLDYSVVDRNNDKVGSVEAVWQDHTGEPAYLGIRTGWLGFGQAHVVPAQAVEASEATRKLRLPYTVDVVKNAPSFDEQADIDDAAERRIADYYRGHGLQLDPFESDREIGQSDPGRADRDLDTRHTEDEVTIPLSKEEVKIGKRDVEMGGVRLRKVVRTETVNQPVELEREEIVVERVPVSEARPSRSDIPFREEEIYIPLRREEAVVEKVARTTEEVRVGKRRETERRDVSETVRREEVDIDREEEKRRVDR